MSVTGLTRLSELALNQSIAQGTTAPPQGQPAQPPILTASAVPIDTFTSSAQTGTVQGLAEAAGIFQASLFVPASTTASNAAPQTLLPPSGRAAAVAETPQTPVTGADAVQIGAANPNTQTTAKSAPGAPAPPKTGPAGTGSQAPTAQKIPPPSATGAAATTQGELLALNAELSSLGLSDNDIQYIDSLASTTNEFSPTSYSNLVQQFQAQTSAQSTVTTAANTASTQTGGPT